MTTIRKAGVIGAGTMGNGIAQACATAGVPVVMLDVDHHAVDRGMAAIGNSLDRLLKKEKIAAADKDAARARRVTEFKEKFANPYTAAARGFIDEVIRPRQTRAKLIAALAVLDTKRDKNPPKKHGNIPL